MKKKKEGEEEKERGEGWGGGEEDWRRGGNKFQEWCSNCTEVSSFLKVPPRLLSTPWAPANHAHPECGVEDRRWAGNAFLIFCMDALVTIKILSKGSNFKEEKLA